MPPTRLLFLYLYIYFLNSAYLEVGTLFFSEGGKIFLVKDKEEVREGGFVKESCFFFFYEGKMVLEMRERWVCDVFRG